MTHAADFDYADAGRRGGRPSLRPGEASYTVSVRLPVSEYDALCRVARRRGLSISAFMREAVARALPGGPQPFGKVTRSVRPDIRIEDDE